MNVSVLKTGPVSVVIKALNEEAQIEASVRSALTALNRLDGSAGEVVLSDSHSTDATVARAGAYPVRIVQLLHPLERRCGVGPQLGYTHTDSPFIYLMDGDMQLKAEFLPKALALLQDQPDLAGVGGQVLELNADHLEYRARNEKPQAQARSAEVDRLDGGGLYRRSAIESVGYLSDRNLHSYEEYELGLRLRERGWKLWRLPDTAVTHQGHATAPYRLLLHRWRSGYIMGLGELLRASWAHPLRRQQVLGLRETRLYLGLMAAWLMLILGLLLPVPAQGKWVAASSAPLLALAMVSLRKRSLERGLYAVVAWHVNAAGLLRGLLHRRRSPTEKIASRVLKEPCSLGINRSSDGLSA